MSRMNTFLPQNASQGSPYEDEIDPPWPKRADPSDTLFPKSPDFRRCRGSLCRPGTPAAAGVDFCSDRCRRDDEVRRDQERAAAARTLNLHDLPKRCETHFPSNCVCKTGREL